EAATLYLERLNNRRAAAECYRQAGLLSDAVRLYLELGEFLEAGDLYQLLEQPEEAAEQYRRAIAQLAAAGDLVAAARVWEQKLADPDQGLSLLTTGWPYAPRARACLNEWYGMSARHGRHAAATERTRSIRRDPFATNLGGWIVEALAEVSE